jgi:chaperonin GroEL
MSTTNSVFGTELKEQLLAGIEKLNKTVSSTLGPGGRTVLIREPNGEVKATKDGVTVAKSFIKLENDFEDLGAQMVKQVSIKSANEAGDGTTTSTLLATKMIQEGMKAIRQGVNAVEVKIGIDKTVTMVIEELKKNSVDISTEDQIKQVAVISGNNDTEVGELISAAIDKVGREGLITIEESKTGETTLEVVEGMQFDRGYKSPYFVTDNTSMQAIMDDAYIMLFDGRINSAAEIIPFLQKANSENKSILIVAEDFGDEALALMVVNKMRGVVKVCAVKAPDFGDRRTLILEDMAILTSATLMSKSKGHKLEKINPQDIDKFLGRARIVTVGKEETTIVDGKGDAEAIVTRSHEIKDQIDKAQSFFEKEKLQERLGKLIGGVAIINVGGNSEIEMKEKKDRVEDALLATKAALVDGILPGGGIALIRAVTAIKNNTAGWKDNEKIGFNIVSAACHEPFKKILSNAGIENWYEILHGISSKDDNFATYDAKGGNIVSGLHAGLLDPTKVVTSSIKNAASVAGTILTVESVVLEKKSEKEDNSSHGIPGMENMM